MKVLIPNNHAGEENHFGGGWTFKDNLIKSLPNIEFIEGNKYQECDIVLIAGATMTDNKIVDEANKQGKKIILRVDNIPRNSRNRNSGCSRLKHYSNLADAVIYQSQWAYDFINLWLNPKGKIKIILNGADPEIFNPDGDEMPKNGKRVYLYTRSSRDETKGWELAWYQYIMEARKYENTILYIVGRFSPDNMDYNFDFFDNESYQFFGQINDKNTMATLYRTADVIMVPFQLDACSNTLIESRFCAGKDTKIEWYPSGGNKEIMEVPLEKLTIKYMGKQYLKIFEEILKCHIIVNN